MKITDSPVPDEMRKCNAALLTYIPITPNTGLCPSRDCASWLTIVSSNFPCSKMTEIQRAIPTIKAPYMRFWQPARKVEAISFAFIPPIIPDVIAMKIKVAVISASVQCRRKAPIKNTINDKAETSKINL
ncbi:hypothetical protein BN2127_JRS10_04707 [Bacillus subtilis]|nr:hypothetical protein BN2127_JRS10_04707 [Bacillus subtilis]